MNVGPTRRRDNGPLVLTGYRNVPNGNGTGPGSSKTAVSGGLAFAQGRDAPQLELPAAAGLEDETRPSDGKQGDQDAHGMSQGSVAAHQKSHLIPAPSERAVAARAATTSVKRARFAFNAHLQ
jgi:hypothetical protein